MWGEVNVWLYMAVSFHSWSKKLFLGVNQHPSDRSWQLPLMGFEPQRRGVSSFKARRLNHSATEAPVHMYIVLAYILFRIFILIRYSIHLQMLLHVASPEILVVNINNITIIL